MKSRYSLLSTLLTVALTLPMFGQGTHDDTTKTGMKHHDMSGMMGKPTVDATVDGVHMKVWLMTQKKHKEMGEKMRHMMHEEKEEAMEHKGMKDSSMAMDQEMKGMDHEGMGMSKAMKDSMMAGTHHIMLLVSDAVAGKELKDVSARVLIVSPSKKNSSVDLRAMMGHFGNALTLDEKGKYQMTISVDANGVSRTKEFQYAVK